MDHRFSRVIDRILMIRYRIGKPDEALIVTGVIF